MSINERLKVLQADDMVEFCTRPVSRPRPALTPRGLWRAMALDTNRGPNQSEVRRHKDGSLFRAEQKLSLRAMGEKVKRELGLGDGDVEV